MTRYDTHPLWRRFLDALITDLKLALRLARIIEKEVR